MATYEDEPRSGRLLRTAAISALALLIVAGLAVIIGNGSRDTASTPSTTIELAVAPTVATAPPVETTVPATTAAPSALPCPNDDGNNPQTRAFPAEPPVCIVADKRYRAKIRTDQGTIWVLLDQTAAPAAVNNFVYLARYNFYNGLTVHKVFSDYIMQSGSPTPDGEGGPGYALSAQEAGVEPFKVGTVAMADRGNGSQFMIITGATGAGLNPADFAPLGTVTQGLDVVKKINGFGSDTGTPTQLVTIRSLEIVADGGSEPTTTTG